MSAAKLYQKLASCMQQIGRVPKNGHNDHHNYDYATEADVTEHVRKILSENGVAFLASVDSYEQVAPSIVRVIMEITLADVETGYEIKTKWVGEGHDKTDKAIYKAYTGAIKYALMKTFLIPTGDDPEEDSRDQSYGRQIKDSRFEDGSAEEKPPQAPTVKTKKLSFDPKKPVAPERVSQLIAFCTQNGLPEQSLYDFCKANIREVTAFTDLTHGEFDLMVKAVTQFVQQTSGGGN